MDQARICGVDEAGRGALAGPVVAACVILDKDLDETLFKDSKVLNRKRRDELFAEISHSNSIVTLGILSHRFIDRNNILVATLEAMKRSIIKLPEKPTKVLIDGNASPNLPDYDIQTIVKGDQLCAVISAASIVAKVTRDHIMTCIDRKFPEYGFLQNMGYGTQKHYDAIFKVGISAVHRKSFNFSRQNTLFDTLK